MRGAYLHHLFNVPALLPVGDLLVHAQEWTGVRPPRSLACSRARARIHSGPTEELERLGPRSGATPPRRSCWTRRRARRGRSRRSARCPARRARSRGPTSTRRLPTGQRRGRRRALAARAPGAHRRGDPRGAGGGARRRSRRGWRAGPPSARRRAAPPTCRLRRAPRRGAAVYRLRDERGTYADLWAIGIMRRAILAAGARLAATDGSRTRRTSSRPTTPSCAPSSRRAAARRPRSSPSGRATACGRATWTRRRCSARAGPPLPAEWLPPAAARLERALGAAVGGVVRRAGGADARSTRCAASASARASTRAPPAWIRGTEEFGRIERGDVLVTNSTTTAFNIVLPLLGAIVTDRGGLLSHAAIVAREYGIPAVVGCTDATAVSRDGARCASTERWRGGGSRMTEVAAVRGVPELAARVVVRRSGSLPPGFSIRPGGDESWRRSPKGSPSELPSSGARPRSWLSPRARVCPSPPVLRFLSGSWTPVAAGDRDARYQLAEMVRAFAAPLVARSSAVGEDSEQASFAWAAPHPAQHPLRAPELAEAVSAIRESAWLALGPRVPRASQVARASRGWGVVVQELVDADSVGRALFSRDPVNGSDELSLVEAAWGLGEAVVAGIVTPDRFRMAPERSRSSSGKRPEGHRHPHRPGRRHARDRCLRRDLTARSGSMTRSSLHSTPSSCVAMTSSARGTTSSGHSPADGSISYSAERSQRSQVQLQATTSQTTACARRTSTVRSNRHGLQALPDLVDDTYAKEEK